MQAEEVAGDELLQDFAGISSNCNKVLRISFSHNFDFKTKYYFFLTLDIMKKKYYSERTTKNFDVMNNKNKYPENVKKKKTFIFVKNCLQ